VSVCVQGPCGTRTVLDAVLPPGQYYLVVEGYSTSEGRYSVDMECSSGPDTNIDSGQTDFIACTGSHSTVNGSTVGMPSNFGNSAGEAMFFFNISGSAGQTSFIQFDSCASTYDTWLRILSLDSPNPQERTGCDDCGNCGTRTVLDADLPPGQYALLVEGFSNREGSYSVTMTCGQPTSRGARQMIQCGHRVHNSTSNHAIATNVIGQPSHEIMYDFTMATAGLIQFSSCGSNFDTWLRIMSPDLGSELVGCDDCVR
jgi:hypothetical protein